MHGGRNTETEQTRPRPLTVFIFIVNSLENWSFMVTMFRTEETITVDRSKWVVFSDRLGSRIKTRAVWRVLHSVKVLIRWEVYGRKFRLIALFLPLVQVLSSLQGFVEGSSGPWIKTPRKRRGWRTWCRWRRRWTASSGLANIAVWKVDSSTKPRFVPEAVVRGKERISSSLKRRSFNVSAEDCDISLASTWKVNSLPTTSRSMSVPIKYTDHNHDP